MARRLDHGAASPRRLGRLALLSLLLVLASSAPATARVPAEFFGVTAVRPTNQDFEAMQFTGLGTVRVEVNWRSVQQRRGGPLSWHGSDVRFQQAVAYGLRPLPVLFGTPRFIERRDGKFKPPVRTRGDRRQWQRFVAGAISRYGPDGSFWGEHHTRDPALAPKLWIIWNEQNARAFWRPKVSPREYARLVRITRRAARAVDPRTRLVAGGMYGYPAHEKSMHMSHFLRRLYRQRGVRAALAGVSLHPYASGIPGVRRQVRKARRIMDRAGHRRGKIVIGETGWASGGPRREFLVKRPSRQAELLERVHGLFLRKRTRWRIPHVMWFAWRNYAVDAKGCRWCPKAGLVREDLSPKPAWYAYTELIHRRVRPGR